jgi:hypothetical protein
MRGFGLASLMVAFLGLAGCGADNETEADRLQKTSGPPPATDVKGKETGPPTANLQDYAKQKQAAPLGDYTSEFKKNATKK